MRIPVLLALFFLLLAVVSCKMDDEVVSAALGEVPDTVSWDLRQVSVSPNGRVETEADKMEVYNSKDLTVFHGASMTETNAEGEETLNGRADYIELTGDLDADISGNIVANDPRDGSRLEAQVLYWTNQERLLVGEGEVFVDTGDGLTVRGEGFEADIARQVYSFSSGVSGTLDVAESTEVTESEEDE